MPIRFAGKVFALAVLFAGSSAFAQQAATPAAAAPLQPGMRAPSGQGTTTPAQAAANVTAHGPVKATAMTVVRVPAVAAKAANTGAATPSGAKRASGVTPVQ